MVPASFATNLSASTKVVPVADVPPSTILSSAAVESTAANFVKSACTNPETPSSKLSSAAVEVTAVPFIDKASVSKVPSISASPDTSKDPASNSPDKVIFLNPV